MNEEYSIMDVARIDEPAPEFTMPGYDPKIDDEITVHSEDLQGSWSVLFFYPADFTFVCPTELKDLADAKSAFDEMGVKVFTVSTDSVFSHRAWTKQEGLMKDFPHVMLADQTTEVSYDYNLLDAESGMAGRGTYIIDPNGIIRGIEITSGPLGRNSAELVRKIQALQHMESNPGTACPAKWTPGQMTLTPSIKISGEVEEQLK